MKNIIIATLIISMFGGASYYEHNYARENCKVIQSINNTVRVEDQCGFIWDVVADGLKAGDIVTLKMDDNNTSSYIFDDIITDVVKQ